MAVQLFGTFFLALLASWLLTPVVRVGALRSGLVDHPGPRRMHAVPMPKGGGLAIYAAFWLAVLLLPLQGGAYWGLWAASTVMLLVGLVDDRYELRWYLKLGGQIAAAVLFCLWGGRIEFVTHPISGDMVHIGWWGVPLTIVWLVALANMVNLIDGLDGLAAGVCVIACAPLFIVAMSMGRTDAALLTVALGAAALGFLPHNFSPARIIMGDTGAMFLGFVLAAISVEGALKGPTALAFIAPVLALGLPIFDTLFSVVRRVAANRPIYEADRDHLHHRLLAMGLSQRQAVLTLYGVSAVLGAGALLTVDAGVRVSLGVFLLVLAGMALFAYRVGGLGGTHTSGARVARKMM